MKNEFEPKPISFNILLVESEENWLQVSTDVFESLGSTVTGVTDKTDAIQAIAKGSFSHLITSHLDGAWKKIALIAKEKGIPNIILLSDDEYCLTETNNVATFVHKKEVEKIGIVFVTKKDISLGNVKYPDLLQLSTS